MAISDNITEVRDRIIDELDADNKTTVNRLRKEAMSAMRKGQSSPEWATYMENFAKTIDELNHLIPKNDDGEVYIDPDPAKDVARFYLVRNGMCTITTTRHIGENVDTVANN